jgi:hypothetical protein
MLKLQCAGAGWRKSMALPDWLRLPAALLITDAAGGEHVLTEFLVHAYSCAALVKLQCVRLSWQAARPLTELYLVYTYSSAMLRVAVRAGAGWQARKCCKVRTSASVALLYSNAAAL